AGPAVFDAKQNPGSAAVVGDGIIYLDLRGVSLGARRLRSRSPPTLNAAPAARKGFTMADSPKDPAATPAFAPFAAGLEYMTDAAQRTVLFWDVMRQRGNQYNEHLNQVAPHVLDYAAELLIDGRTLERPVNYALARIIPPKGVEIDPTRRPFVVVDPRAGHGPGIGGF